MHVADNKIDTMALYRRLENLEQDPTLHSKEIEEKLTKAFVIEFKNLIEFNDFHLSPHSEWLNNSGILWKTEGVVFNWEEFHKHFQKITTAKPRSTKLATLSKIINQCSTVTPYVRLIMINALGELLEPLHDVDHASEKIVYPTPPIRWPSMLILTNVSVDLATLEVIGNLASSYYCARPVEIDIGSIATEENFKHLLIGDVDPERCLKGTGYSVQSFSTLMVMKKETSIHEVADKAVNYLFSGDKEVIRFVIAIIPTEEYQGGNLVYCDFKETNDSILLEKFQTASKANIHCNLITYNEMLCDIIPIKTEFSNLPRWNGNVTPSYGGYVRTPSVVDLRGIDGDELP